MKNPFKTTSYVGYRWWTLSHGDETSEHWGWIKVGPVSFAWGDWFGHRHFEVSVIATWLLVRCCTTDCEWSKLKGFCRVRAWNARS